MKYHDGRDANYCDASLGQGAYAYEDGGEMDEMTLAGAPQFQVDEIEVFAV